MRITMRTLTAAIVVMLFAAVAQASAQNTRGRWWHVPDIAQQLKLTDDEVRQLDAAFDAARIKMIEFKSKVEIERVKLRSLMEQRDFSEEAVMQQQALQEAARAQLSRERFKFLLAVRKIVGPDRFLQLLDMRDAYRHHRHAGKKSTAKEKP